MNAAAVATETTAAVTFQEAENLYIYRSCKNLGAHSPLDVTGLTAKTSISYGCLWLLPDPETENGGKNSFSLPFAFWSFSKTCLWENLTGNHLVRKLGNLVCKLLTPYNIENIEGQELS